jgi:hypothetical protein
LTCQKPDQGTWEGCQRTAHLLGAVWVVELDEMSGLPFPVQSCISVRRWRDAHEKVDATVDIYNAQVGKS